MLNVKYNVMLHSVQLQFRLTITVLAMLLLTGCSTNINWFPSKQFTMEDWRRSPVLSVTQQCVDDFIATRTIEVTSLHHCTELSITIAEF